MHPKLAALLSLFILKTRWTTSYSQVMVLNLLYDRSDDVQGMSWDDIQQKTSIDI